MIKKLIGQAFIWLVIVGSISYAVAWILGDPTPTILSPYTVTYGNNLTITLYRLNVYKYLQNLQETIKIPFKNMYLEFPKPYQMKFSGNPLESFLQVLKQFANSYIWFINAILWITNLTIIMPTKLIIQPLMLSLSLLGINTTGLGLVKIADTIYSTNITYIKYWS